MQGDSKEVAALASSSRTTVRRYLFASQSTIVPVSWPSARALTKMPIWPPLRTTSV